MAIFVLACIFMSLNVMNVLNVMPWSNSLERYRQMYTAALVVPLEKETSSADGNIEDDDDDNVGPAYLDSVVAEEEEPSSLLWNTIRNRNENNYNNNLNIDAEEEQDEVLAVMKRIRQLNACSMSSECRNAHSLQQLPQPVLNLAMYRGQGMGRLLVHSATTCLVAASVGRPCMIDQTIRDPHYSFRSFVQSRLDVDIDTMVGLYDKNHTYATRPLLSEETAREAQRAISLLPNPASGQWTKDSLNDAAAATFDHVVPLGNWETTGDPSHALLDNPDKLGISPNWGDSWFTKKEIKWPCLIATDRYAQGEHECSQLGNARLNSLMQNYMYQPTPLSHSLHNLHKQLVLEEKEKAADARHNGGDSEEVYGAIHLRFVLLKKMDPNNDDHLRAKAQQLHQCLQYWQEEEPSITKWWLVTDKMKPGVNLTNFINEEAANSTTGTKIEVFTENGWPETSAQAQAKRVNGKMTAENQAQAVLRRVMSHRVGGELSHSLSPASTSPLGHEYLASSMMDWMVLYESKLAIITQGAFGGSGASGNGKYYHPSTSTQETNSCLGLSVYRH
ncbi:MAG: hypothetical protein SGARI_001797 [Bacillariaceae sp.]